MKKILVPRDFSETSIQAFKFALELASCSNGEVMLLNVIELPVMRDTVLMPTLSHLDLCVEVDIQKSVLAYCYFLIALNTRSVKKSVMRSSLSLPISVRDGRCCAKYRWS